MAVVQLVRMTPLSAHQLVGTDAVRGSLIHEGCFTRWSDVDIAAWGISPDATFRAIGAVMNLEPDIIVSLVDVETCRPSLLAVIEREGIEL
jgi:hypothetical protein